MKYKVSFVIVLSLLLATAAFAGEKIAVNPTTATVFVNGPARSVMLDGFCNQNPCNLKWSAILSNNQVGSIDKTSGPQTKFTAGSLPGEAYIFLTDGQGNVKLVTIHVQ